MPGPGMIGLCLGPSMSIFKSLLSSSIYAILANSFHLELFALRTFSGGSPSAIFLALQVLALLSGSVQGFFVPGKARFILTGLCTLGLTEDGSSGSWPSLPASGGEPGGCCWMAWARRFRVGSLLRSWPLWSIGVVGPCDDLLSWTFFRFLGVLVYLVLAQENIPFF